MRRLSFPSPFLGVHRALLPVVLALGAARAAAPAPAPAPAPDLWSRDNLAAWCIVPFDTARRDAAARAAMLERLQIRRLAYDWRAEHVPHFDAEVIEMQRRGIEILAWWFPNRSDAAAQRIVEVISRHGIRPQLWTMGGAAPLKDPAGQEARVAEEAAKLRPVLEIAARLGCPVGLYNHGGWFGEPENQLAILARLRAEGFTNVGLVYNFHHGHDHLDRFPELWRRIQAHTIAVNLNGMVAGGDRTGRKILYLGEGDRELGLLRIIQESGWRGPVGLLNHRMDTDAEVALRANLAGLEQLTKQLPGAHSLLKRPAGSPNRAQRGGPRRRRGPSRTWYPWGGDSRTPPAAPAVRRSRSGNRGGAARTGFRPACRAAGRESERRLRARCSKRRSPGGNPWDARLTAVSGAASIGS